mgnify:FL=1
MTSPDKLVIEAVEKVGNDGYTYIFEGVYLNKLFHYTWEVIVPLLHSHIRNIGFMTLF